MVGEQEKALGLDDEEGGARLQAESCSEQGGGLTRPKAKPGGFWRGIKAAVSQVRFRCRHFEIK